MHVSAVVNSGNLIRPAGPRRGPVRAPMDSDLALSHVIDLLLDAVVIVDAEGRFVFVSAAFERIFGYTPQEVVGTSMIDLVHPEDRRRTIEAAAEIMAGKPNPHFQNRYVRKDGQIVHVMWSARWSEIDRMRIAVARDITELKQAEATQEALHAISEAAHTTEDLVALFRRIHQIIGELLPAINCFVALYDARSDDLSFPYFVDEFDDAPGPRKLDSGTLSAIVIRSGEALLLTPETRAALAADIAPAIGRESLDWLGVPLRSSQGVIGALVVQSYSGDVRYTEKDKTLLQFVSTQIGAAIERKQTQARLEYIARHDPLTGLPNRDAFDDRLQAALADARHTGKRLSVLYIDLDNFKPVNDRFGHDVGDLLLRDAALRIRSSIRESDTVGRVGGDEFGVLLENIGRAEHAAAIAEAICAALGQPFELRGEPVNISTSIGIALYPDHGDGDRQLMRYADNAMYAAKRTGGNRLRFAEITDGGCEADDAAA